MLEGRSREWSGWVRDWSQKGLIFDDVCLRVAAGTGQRMEEGLDLEWTSFGGTVWKVADCS
jgi:hypothetical protein